MCDSRFFLTFFLFLLYPPPNVLFLRTKIWCSISKWTKLKTFVSCRCEVYTDESCHFAHESYWGGGGRRWSSLFPPSSAMYWCRCSDNGANVCPDAKPTYGRWFRIFVTNTEVFRILWFKYEDMSASPTSTATSTIIDALAARLGQLLRIYFYDRLSATFYRLKRTWQQYAPIHSFIEYLHTVSTFDNYKMRRIIFLVRKM